MDGFGLLVELHLEGSAPAACAVGFFFFLTPIINKTKLKGLLTPRDYGFFTSENHVIEEIL